MTKTTSRQKKPPAQLRHYAKMAVVPHAHNQYRPHLVRWRGLVIIALLVIGLQFGWNYFHSGSVLGREANVSAEQLLDDTNAEREAHGLAPLHANDRLDRAAYLKAKDMFDKQYWAHTAPDGTEPWHWFEAADYSYESAGENLAKGFYTASGVVTAWMNSQEHRQNILDKNYEDVGFAIMSGKLNGEDTTLVVALYGRPAAVALSGVLHPTVLGAADAPLGIVGRIGVGIQSMTPAMLGSLVLLLAVTMVALGAHAYRAKLPKAWRQGWRRHHGLYKAAGMASLALMVIVLYGGGQI